MQVAKYIILVLTIAATFLLSPAPTEKDDFCGYYVRLSEIAGYFENCDAQGYYDATKHPSQLLNQNEIRQSRPLFILASAVINAPLGYISQLFGQSRFLGHQIGFLLINLAILISGLILLSKILKEYLHVQSPLLILSLQILLISNQITKAFFWTIHQQMFTLFTSLLCCWLALKLYYKKPVIQKIRLYAFGGGISMLVYGNFLIVLPVLLVFHWINKKSVKDSALILFLFLAPTILWVLLLRLIGVNYYNHETEAYRQLVWIPETLKESFAAFGASLLSHTIAFFNTFREIIFILALSVLAMLFALKRKMKANVLILGTVFLFYFIFLWLLGFYQERLTFNIFPVLLLMIGLGLEQLENKKKVITVFFCFIIVWHIYHVVSHGPYS